VAEAFVPFVWHERADRHRGMAHELGEILG
jgi:hypothetical protein